VVKIRSTLIFCFFLICGLARATDISREIRWTINLESLEPFELDLQRGETVDLVTTWKNYGSVKNLTPANTAALYYRPWAETNTSWRYAASGTIYNATGGVTKIRWTPMCEATNSRYRYNVVVSAYTTTVVSAQGLLLLQNNLAGEQGTNAAPRQYNLLDWLTVQHQNVGSAPFVSSYDIDDVRSFMNGCLDGSQSLDVNNLNVRGSLTGSAADLTNWPTNIVTILNGGTSGTTGTVTRSSNNVFTLTFPVGGDGGGGGVSYLTNLLDVAISNPQDGDVISYNGSNWFNKATGESLTTNRLTWVVGGETIGYVDTNGITMLKGSLQLFEEDLNCNVRAYDGSKSVPSVSFYASPTLGWYRKSYGGDYAWAFAASSNDVLYLHRLGLTMAGTNTVNSYYFNATGAYKISGATGRTTNLTVVTSISTNGSGAVTSMETQTLHFVGGLLTE